ncbi:MAG: tripartite tricarboxylate transporter substrate binding protein [Hyphomicrobiales bacterium]|nr:MAG: tripartite tricarboxylate transporter substrate binding protein [Hyphomicrobiales bacterium]
MDRRQFTAALSGLALAPFMAHAQDYPTKPIRFIVPFPPGAGSDAISRQTGERMSKGLEQPVVIENRAGAAGNIGMEYAARQAPDGYTIALISTSTAILNPITYRNLGYKPEKDFAPIGVIARQPYILAVNPNVPARTLQELVALAKANPGKLSFASPGNGHATHLGGELMKEMAGIDMIHVPYQGSGPATTDLIGGQTTMMFVLASDGTQIIKSGRLRAIATAAPTRAAQLPEVPTFQEAGFPDFDLTAWFGLVGVAGMPPATVQRLNVELNKALADPTMRKWLMDGNQEPVGGSPEDFSALMAKERRRWAPVIKKAGMAGTL